MDACTRQPLQIYIHTNVYIPVIDADPLISRFENKFAAPKHTHIIMYVSTQTPKLAECRKISQPSNDLTSGKQGQLNRISRF